jgi:hypothetical protein
LPTLFSEEGNSTWTSGFRWICPLPGCSTLSFSVGKKIWKGSGARLEFENVTNRVYPINPGSEFNGTHFSAPRMLTLRLDYDF